MGLPTRTKQFTLLRSPLGNKKAKDQFERREYRNYCYYKTQEASKILGFLEVLRTLNGVKLKVKVSNATK